MEENILVVKDKYIYREIEYTLDDFFTLDFYDWANEKADEYSFSCIFDNLIYLNVLLNVLAIRYFIKKNKISEIKAHSIDKRELCYILDAAKLENVNVSYNVKPYVFRTIQVKMVFLIEFVYLFFQQISTKFLPRSIDLKKDVCVNRTSAARKKILPTDTREIFVEDKVATGDLYSFFDVQTRKKCLRKAYKSSLELLDTLNDFMDRFKLEYTKNVAFDFVKMRFIPVLFYGEVLDKLLALDWKGKFISGNNLDMYAAIEEIVAKKNGLDTVCIPHGLEYGYKFPHCFTGNTFFATSFNAAEHLNKLYGVEKFIFSKDVVEGMFCFRNERCLSNEKKVVYFSEPREPEVNIRILKILIPLLKEEKIQLYIKHHPKDNLTDYEIFAKDLIEVDDLQEAICGNVCIARKSTTLLEGLYNNAICAAIITNEKDNAIFHTFPSLQDDRINQFYDVTSLKKWIVEQMKGV